MVCNAAAIHDGCQAGTSSGNSGSTLLRIVLEEWQYFGDSLSTDSTHGAVRLSMTIARRAPARALLDSIELGVTSNNKSWVHILHEATTASVAFNGWHTSTFQVQSIFEDLQAAARSLQALARTTIIRARSKYS
jgi:hypothetical protein